MALLTHLDIVNAACARIGADAPQDWTTDTGDTGPISLIYEETVDFNLGVYLFSFARQLFQLSVDDTLVNPASGYRHVFDLPPERQGQPLYITDNVRNPDARFSRYVLIDGRVHADANPLWAMCRYRPDPHAWDPAFKAATITALASRFALSLASDRSTSEQLAVQAWGTPSENFRGGELGAAIRADAFSTPPRLADFENNPLSNARR